MRNRQKQPRGGFTLIELLVVMAIISALVGIMSVGLRQVKIVSTNLKQKGEFHGLEISIELFQNEFGFYPNSSQLYGGSNYVNGAQRLAEAMQGRDERGFHPQSKWHPDVDAAQVAPHPGASIYTDATLKQRKPVYFELKHSGLYDLGQLWDTAHVSGAGLYTGIHLSPPTPAPVITDIFVRNSAADTSIKGKVGSPVLYFKADPTKRFRVNSARQLVSPATQAEYVNWVYNFDDNIDILRLPWLRDPDVDTDNAMPPHFHEPDADYPDSTGAERFYRMITQRQDTTTNFYKPYNQDTFILISAGWDGIFGTKDDLTNFNY
jgi:prepilin-type N-terminal cleavage/methylation domain-containing protein